MFLIWLSLFTSCRTNKLLTNLDAVDGYILRAFKDLNKYSIDLTEDYYLLYLSSDTSNTVSVNGSLYKLTVLAIHHPDGVELCCADESINRDQPKVDLENLSFLEIGEMMSSANQRHIKISNDYNLQFFAFSGKFCICKKSYSIVKYDLFDSCAYISEAPKFVQNASEVWRIIRDEDRLKILSKVVAD